MDDIAGGEKDEKKIDLDAVPGTLNEHPHDIANGGRLLDLENPFYRSQLVVADRHSEFSKRGSFPRRGVSLPRRQRFLRRYYAEIVQAVGQALVGRKLSATDNFTLNLPVNGHAIYYWWPMSDEEKKDLKAAKDKGAIEIPAAAEPVFRRGTDMVAMNKEITEFTAKNPGKTGILPGSFEERNMKIIKAREEAARKAKIEELKQAGLSDDEMKEEMKVPPEKPQTSHRGWVLPGNIRSACNYDGEMPKRVIVRESNGAASIIDTDDYTDLSEAEAVDEAVNPHDLIEVDSFEQGNRFPRFTREFPGTPLEAHEMKTSGFPLVLAPDEYTRFFLESMGDADFLKKQPEDIFNGQTGLHAQTKKSVTTTSFTSTATLINSSARRIALKRPGKEYVAGRIEELAASLNYDVSIGALVQLLRDMGQVQIERAKIPSTPVPDRLKAGIGRIFREGNVDEDVLLEVGRQLLRHERIPYVSGLDREKVVSDPPEEDSKKAVLFCLMDAAAYFDNEMMEMAERSYFMMKMFLDRQYGPNNVILEFVCHAEHKNDVEVDESGLLIDKEKKPKTLFARALKVVKNRIKTRYSDDKHDVFVLQVSAGTPKAKNNYNHCAEAQSLLSAGKDALLKKCKFFGFVEVLNAEARKYFAAHSNVQVPTPLWSSYNPLAASHQNFKHCRATSVKEMMDKIFSKLVKPTPS